MADGLYRAVRRLMRRVNRVMVRHAEGTGRIPTEWVQQLSWSKSESAALLAGLRQWPDLADAVRSQTQDTRKALAYMLKLLLRLRGPLLRLRAFDEQTLSLHKRIVRRKMLRYYEEGIVSISQAMPGAGITRELNNRSGFPVADSLTVTFLMYAVVVDAGVRRELAAALGENPDGVV